MAKPRLKVFRTQLGFEEVIVAASSQAKALEAWDVHQNLFAEKMADVLEDDALGAPALVTPGMVLRRPMGSNQSFSEKTQRADAPSKRKGARGSGARATKLRRPHRSALDKAEKALGALEEQTDRALNDLAAERRRLDARERELNAAAAKARMKAETAIRTAKRAFAKAGGSI